MNGSQEQRVCVVARLYLSRTSLSVFQRGETALHMAARAGQADVVKYLVQNGARVEAKAKVRLRYGKPG